jgi:hypothetical protein
MTNVQKGLPKVIALTNDDQDKHLATLTTTSSKIRYLASVGFSNDKNLYSGIANKLGLRTQHVRNVLTQPLKK